MTEASTEVRFGGRLTRSTRGDWLTPAPLKRQVYARWNLFFDPCPWPRPPGWDGLKAPWEKRAFVNPPYDATSRWITKAHAELLNGNTVIAVFLINSRTGARWFHDLVLASPLLDELRFIRGRVSFQLPGHAKGGAVGFDWLLVAFRKEPPRPPVVGSFEGA